MAHWLCCERGITGRPELLEPASRGSRRQTAQISGSQLGLMSSATVPFGSFVHLEILRQRSALDRHFRFDFDVRIQHGEAQVKRAVVRLPGIGEKAWIGDTNAKSGEREDPSGREGSDGIVSEGLPLRMLQAVCLAVAHHRKHQHGDCSVRIVTLTIWLIDYIIIQYRYANPKRVPPTNRQFGWERL